LTLRGLVPDYVLLIGDRYEALAVATTCSMLGYCIVHLQGGEHSGNIDNSIRHAISKLSHYHVPATQDAKSYLMQLGEKEDNILAVGCPSADLVPYTKKDRDIANSVLCMFHPETGMNNALIMRFLLPELAKLGMKVNMFWPNIDPGSEGINKVIRRYISEQKPEWLNMIVNLDPIQFMTMLASVRCCIGNSSSMVRDASFFGTPVVLLGSRQIGRIKTINIKWINDYDLTGLHCKIIEHMQKVFEPSDYYGKSGISNKIIDTLKETERYTLKVNHG